jgi:hypothetical protein
VVLEKNETQSHGTDAIDSWRDVRENDNSAVIRLVYERCVARRGFGNKPYYSTHDCVALVSINRHHYHFSR